MEKDIITKLTEKIEFILKLANQFNVDGDLQDVEESMTNILAALLQSKKKDIDYENLAKDVLKLADFMSFIKVSWGKFIECGEILEEYSS